MGLAAPQAAAGGLVLAAAGVPQLTGYNGHAPPVLAADGLPAQVGYDTPTVPCRCPRPHQTGFGRRTDPALSATPMRPGRSLGMSVCLIQPLLL
jgi:hypothetical protein